MKLIINIPDTMYDWFNTGFPDDDDFQKLWNIVRNGTLISATELKNVPVCKAEICINCKHYRGGGDWGLACAKHYYKLPNAGSKVCEDVEWKEYMK